VLPIVFLLVQSVFPDKSARKISRNAIAYTAKLQSLLVVPITWFMGLVLSLFGLLGYPQ
jgi:hypothetical protein